MKIAFKDFRAFQETRLIDVRPLTFLVGENSSGKTSFLAALNYMWSLKERLGTPSFNIPPFDLGTFDEIVHRVRGRAKPSCFEIIAEDTITVERKQSVFFFRARFPESRLTDKARMKVTFVDNVGDAVISKLVFEYAKQALIITAEKKLRVQLESPVGEIVFDTQDGQNNLEFEETIARLERIHVSELIFLLRRIIIENDDNNAEDVTTSLALMGAAFEQFLRSFPAMTFASAPVRSNPNRVYTPADQSRTPEGTHTPQRLFKIKESNQAHWEKVKTRLEAFGKMSGMFSAINVARYRSSGSSPFNINVTRKGKQSNIVDVGYGVSQALPILTDLIESPPASGFLFQQPEVHLHPQAQAALGSFFVEHIKSQRRSTIVAETHSDYLIDRVRLHIREGLLKPKDVSLLYFQAEGTSTNVFQLEIDDFGNISHTPTGYREFFVREQMLMLGVSD